MGGLLDSLERALLKQRRKRLSSAIFDKYGGVVQAGPFAGLKLDGRANISRGPLAIKLFGLYEGAVLQIIEENGPFDDVVNIGAADGYFSLGLLKAGLAKRSICFEITEEGRAAIARNAAENGVSDRMVILGVADDNVATHLNKANFKASNSLMLCDIEGAEFDVLSPIMLKAVTGALMIVELHDTITSGAGDRREKLISRLPVGYTHREIRSIPPAWSGIEDFERLNDNDRALVSSEGRKAIGEWLIAYPPG